MTVTATNNYGCNAVDDVVVYVNPLPVANAGLDQNICPYQNTTLTANGGSSFVWNTGNTSASITVSPSVTTTYSVTVTQDGCQASDAIVVNVNPLALANAGPDQTICPGETAVLTAATAGSYLWSNGATTATISVTPGVTTLYTLTVSSGGCISTDEVVVNISSTLTADAGIDLKICSGETATLSASGGSFYSWSNGANTHSISVSPLITTKYTVTTTSGGCSASDEVFVNVNNTPSANAGPNQTVCEGDFVTLSASGGATYLWNNGSVSSTQIIQPSVSSNYIVTVTSLEGCSATDAVQVSVNSLPIVSAGVDQSICMGQSATLSASGGTFYSWSNGESGQSVIVSPTTTTSYVVTVTGSNGCIATDKVIVTVNPLPMVDAGPDQSICAGQVSNLTATLGSSYQWSTGATTANISVSPPSSTTYSVTVLSSAGCIATDDVRVTVNELPTANAGVDQTVCLGTSVNLTASGGASYQWSNGINASSMTVIPASTSTFTVTVTNLSGCSASDNVIVNINSLPVANAGIDQTICLGQSTNLTASGGDGYSWSTGEVTSVINIKPLQTTSYVVTVTNANNCSAFDEVVVTVNPLPVANAGSDQTICSGQTATLTASSGSSYLWNTGASTASIDVIPLSFTTYSVTVTGSNGCHAYDEVSVNVNTLPVADAGIDQSVCFGQKATLVATGGNFYQWSDGSVNQVTTVNPYVSANYSVTVTSSNGCSDVDNVFIFVNSLPVAYAGPDQTICKGESVNLSATGGLLIYGVTDRHLPLLTFLRYQILPMRLL